ncbi:MAG: aminoacyl-tRNA hydrolase [Chloroflexi bacterium HGW-Chloroflexi-2]|nr:MAG: aminoacyl-tRNA hydrolase [Chloroflexi bacterium HGW-Chloroflexi-2]
MGGFMIVGLGNPGKDYQKNRHNVGFMAIDKIAQEFGIENKKVKSKAIIMEGKKDNKKIILVKPQTYMNLSGTAVASLMQFFKISPENLIVIHDDLDLPSLSIRLRPGGGAGGQKGVSSIIQNLGTQQFNRIRIGIGRPPGRMDAADYVLQNFPKQEEKELPFLFDTVTKAVESILESGIEIAMNKFNGENNIDR